MKELFPKQHVMGFGFSLLLTVVALAVIKFDMSFNIRRFTSNCSCASNCTISIIHAHR